MGENPATADAAGINVSRNKYLATCVGAGISGLGGLYYTMDYIKGTWANDGTIESLGWLAVALVIFATWRTVNAIWGSYLFGLLFWVYLIIPGLGRRDTYLFNMLPYLVTIAVLIFVSPAEQEGESAPRQPGSGVFPGGTVASPPYKSRAPRLLAAALFRLFTSPPGGSGLR